MKFRNIKRWELKPELIGLLFFAQRMDELLWDFTHDTHKPMSLNAPYLCKEALALIDSIQNSTIDASNLRPVLDELTWSIQNDPAAKKLLDAPIDQYISSAEEVNIPEQRIRLDVLERTLDPHRYLHLCFDQVSEAVKSGEKKKIDQATRSMVTTLVNIGVSKQSLYKRNLEYFFDPEGPKIQKAIEIDNYLKSLYPFAHQCTVYFIVSSLISSVKDSLDRFSIEIIDELPDKLFEVAITNEFIKENNEVYIAIGPISSLDVFSAQEDAATRLDGLSDLFTLFYHQQTIKWRPLALVEQCCLDGPVAVALSKGAMAKPFDLRPEKASKELNRLLRNLAFPKQSKSFNIFNRVADLHGICVATDIPENQLVTLWTAFETLIPSNSKTSKISNIIESTIPFLMLTYIARLVQRFTHDLIVWKPWETRNILNLVGGVSGANTLQRAIALLALKENEQIKETLYTKLQDFHLLRYRAFQLSEILSSPERLKKTLATHEKKVRWQIRRIYRTRNLIVHSGSSPSYLHAIIENGHEYLDQLVFDVMKLSCGEYRINRISQAFELTKIRYSKFTRTLEETTQFTAGNYEFLCEDLGTLVDFERQFWGVEREAS